MDKSSRSVVLAASWSSPSEQTENSQPSPHVIAPVTCSVLLANRKNDTSDPNQLLDESPKKHVTAINPNFWISLHKSSFDGMRWAHIYNKGIYYETGITEQFKSILDSREKKGIVIDVGMNIGWFTMYSRAMGHRVVGFDPYPIMHTRVCESLALNGWLDDSSVQTFAHGLGEEAAILNMTTGNNPGASSFFEDRLAKKFRRKIEVSVVRLDDVAEQQGWLSNNHEEPIYLWKLDVEGYEYQVLGGAQKLLHSGRVDNIILENSNKNLSQVVDMYSAIYHAGYEIKMLGTVNGDPYHPKMVPPLNMRLLESSVGMDLSGIDKDSPLAFLAKVSCNIWWTKREATKQTTT